MSTDGNFIERVREAYEYSWPKPRVIVLNFPHNPTTATVDLDFFQQVVDFAREHEVVVVHDNAYAELGYDGYEPPSILQADGAKECAVELYSLTKSFSMAGWRVAFLAGNADVVQALAKLKSYLDYGTFQPIQIAATVTMNEAIDVPREVQAVYQRRRDVLIDGLHRMGWDLPRPAGHDVRVGAHPRGVRRDGLGRVRVDARPRGAGGAVARASGSARAARATCASPSSRTSSEPSRRCATSGARSPSSAEPAAAEVERMGPSQRGKPLSIGRAARRCQRPLRRAVMPIGSSAADRRAVRGGRRSGSALASRPRRTPAVKLLRKL